MRSIPCLVLLFLTVGLTTVKAQSDPGLKKRINAYIAATESMDIDQTLALVYPRLFEFSPKTTMKTALAAAYNNPALALRIDSLHLDSTHRTLLYKGGQYTKIDLSFILSMKFKADSAAPVMAKQALPAMKKQFGAASTRLNEKTNEVLVSKSNTMLAVKNAYSKDWTFIDLQGDPGIMNALFEKELITKLEQY